MLQTLYIGLHGAYLLYWALHQRAVPEWTPFKLPATLPVIILAFAVIGVGCATRFYVDDAGIHYLLQPFRPEVHL